MKSQLKIANWLLELDSNQTQKFYAKGVDICNCAYCSNFTASAGRMSSKFIALLAALGIDPKMPAELSEFPSNEEGLHTYLGFYHFTGTIIEGELTTSSTWKESNTLKLDNFTIGFSTELMFVPEDFPAPVLQLEFEVDLPWVLEPLDKTADNQ